MTKATSIACRRCTLEVTCRQRRRCSFTHTLHANFLFLKLLCDLSHSLHLCSQGSEHYRQFSVFSAISALWPLESVVCNLWESVESTLWTEWPLLLALAFCKICELAGFSLLLFLFVCLLFARKEVSRELLKFTLKVYVRNGVAPRRDFCILRSLVWNWWCHAPGRQQGQPSRLFKPHLSRCKLVISAQCQTALPA